jgi:hypothetical protein
MATRIVGAALGDCVHVTGVLSFLGEARRAGHVTEFLGPAIPVERIVEIAASGEADVLALSYRLSPSAAELLLGRLGSALTKARLSGQRMVFGGTEPVARVAQRTGLFEAVFGAPDGPTVEEYLSGRAISEEHSTWARTMLERRRQSYPRPLVRHHFGLPSLAETLRGVARIAESGAVDVISIGPDQNAQEFFFRPEFMDAAQDGAGGVPVRSPKDLRDLYEASRRGNHPLMRCYAGTNDQLAFAALLQETIDNAWAALPVFWYSELDGRSERTLEAAIKEQNEVAGWCATEGVVVERNDQNQWGLRHAHDAVQVAAAVLAAQLTARAGVETYVIQMMLNTPPGITPAMDVAKMGAMDTLVRRRVGDGVTVLREVRAGLFSLPEQPDRARGQLASSVRTGMLVGPDIVHVVAHTEAHHAAEAEEVVAACRLADQVVTDALGGLPDPFLDPRVTARRDHLMAEAGYLLEAVDRFCPGALDGDPKALGRVVRTGLFDAPHLSGSRVAPAEVTTVVDGGCNAVDPATGRRLGEVERVAALTGL